MPQRYKCKLFLDIVLFCLVLQLHHLEKIYEMSRLDFDVPMIEHIKQTPIEKEVKIIYKETPAREVDIMTHRYTNFTACATVCYSGMYQ